MYNIRTGLPFFIILFLITFSDYSWSQERTKTINGKVIEYDKCGFAINDSDAPQYISPEYMGYSYDDLITDLELWRMSEYVKIDSIGLSVQDRPLWQLTISSNPNDVAGKRTVHIHARTHPQETEGFYVTDEMINILLSESDFAQTARANCVFYIIPMYNPDGVVLGHPRTNANNIDLESNWFTFPNQLEVAALKERFTQLMASPNPIEVMLNMHSSSDCERYFVCHDSAGTSPEYYMMEEEYIEGIRAYYLDGILPWDSVVTWTAGNPLKYPESWFWLYHGESVMALTYEDMYQCTGTGNFDSTANAILHGVMDYMGIITDVKQIADGTPTGFELLQNYPNPFNPVTTIKYAIPNVTLSGVEGSRVQLKVYDILGNEVATLLDEFKQAGSYEINFEASKLSSGVYFYQLQASDFVQTKKMLLLK